MEEIVEKRLMSTEQSEEKIRKGMLSKQSLQENKWKKERNQKTNTGKENGQSSMNLVKRYYPQRNAWWGDVREIMNKL